MTMGEAQHRNSTELVSTADLEPARYAQAIDKYEWDCIFFLYPIQ